MSGQLDDCQLEKYSNSITIFFDGPAHNGAEEFKTIRRDGRGNGGRWRREERSRILCARDIGIAMAS